jgi:nitrite reductase/ring-hydroxylating ferredoxin subunit
MRTCVALTPAQSAAVGRGRFVRVDLTAGPSVLVGRAGGAWRAYVNVCRHRDLPLDLGVSSPMSDDARFLACSQHGALYRLTDGLCVMGPCVGERLAPIAITEHDGELVLTADG